MAMVILLENIAMIVCRIVIGCFLLALAVFLGGINVDIWRMALWPVGEVMQRLWWATAFAAFSGSCLTVFVGVTGLFVLLGWDDK